MATGEGVLAVFVANLFFSAVCWVIFLCFRPSTRDASLVDMGVLNVEVKDATRRTQWDTFTSLFTLTEQEITERGGPAAGFYVQVQRRAIGVLAICTVLVIAVLLPIHVEGHYDETGFPATTGFNLSNQASVLWVHVAVAFLVTALVLFTVAELRGVVKRRKEQERAGSIVAAHTVMISPLPSTVADDRTLFTFMNELYGGRVADAHVIPEVHDLVALERKRAKILRKLEHSEAMLLSQRTLCSWGLCRSRSAVDRYQHLLDDVERDIQFHRKCPPRGAGFAFVTFRDVETACACVQEFRKPSRNVVMREVPGHLRVGQKAWRIRMAEEPGDIIWDNLRATTTAHRIRVVAVNVLFILAILFWTSPIAILTSLEGLSDVSWLHSLDWVYDIQSPWRDLLFVYLPILLLYILSQLLVPLAVDALTKLELHHSRSRQALATLLRNFVYLVINLLILPTFLLTSLNSIIQETWRDEHGVVNTIARVLLSQSGSFFVNFLLQAALFGVPLELLRIEQRVLRRWRRRHAPTRREVEEASEAGPFDFVHQFAWMACMFTIVLVYSTMVPLVLPAGLLLFAHKWLVDRHSIAYVYDRCDEDLTFLEDSFLDLIVLGVVLFHLALCAVFSFKRMFAPLALVCVLLFTSLFFAARRLSFSRRVWRFPHGVAMHEAELPLGVKAREMEDEDTSDAFLQGAYRHDYERAPISI